MIKMEQSPLMGLTEFMLGILRGPQKELQSKVVFGIMC